jgi:hypothetical protein
VSINHLINARILSADGVKKSAWNLNHAWQAWTAPRCQRDAARDKEAHISQVN